MYCTVKAEQGKCDYDLYKRSVAKSQNYKCDEKHTIRHIVDTYSKIKFKGHIEKIHKAEPIRIMRIKHLVLRM